MESNGGGRQRSTLARFAATWGYARPGKRKLASAHRARAREQIRQVLYSRQVQQRPLTIASHHNRQHTELAGITAKRPEAPLVRDEEAAGSNPATPTSSKAMTQQPESWPFVVE